MAGVPWLCRDHALCGLPAHSHLGFDHVPLPTAWPRLHYAMVSVRRVSLVPVALCQRPGDAFHLPSARCDAGGGELVVCQWPALPLVWFHWPRDRLLHDPESDRPSGAQLLSGGNWLLELCPLLELDRDAAFDRWAISRLDDHREYRSHDLDDHSGRNRRIESSHD